MANSLMSLEDFQALSGLSDSAFLELLRGPILRKEVDSSGRILVDPTSVNLTQIISSIVANQNVELKQSAGLLREKVGNIILDEIDRIIAEVCARLGGVQTSTAEK